MVEGKASCTSDMIFSLFLRNVNQKTYKSFLIFGITVIVAIPNVDFFAVSSFIQRSDF